MVNVDLSHNAQLGWRVFGGRQKYDGVGYGYRGRKSGSVTAGSAYLLEEVG